MGRRKWRLKSKNKKKPRAYFEWEELNF